VGDYWIHRPTTDGLYRRGTVHWAMPPSRTSQPEDTDRLVDTLEGIELTEEGKQPQREIVFVTDEDRARLLDDPVRIAILKVLRKGMPDTITTRFRDEKTGDLIIRQREVQRHALSVLEIVRMSEEDPDVDSVTKNQVYHHLPRLIEGGFVIKYGTLTTGKRTTDYYRRTAKGFVIVPHVYRTDSKLLKKHMSQMIQRLERVFGISLSQEERKEFTSLMVRLSRIEAQAGREVAKKVTGDILDTEILDLYDFLRRVRASGHPDWMPLQNRLREMLFRNKSDG